MKSDQSYHRFLLSYLADGLLFPFRGLHSLKQDIVKTMPLRGLSEARGCVNDSRQQNWAHSTPSTNNRAVWIRCSLLSRSGRRTGARANQLLRILPKPSPELQSTEQEGRRWRVHGNGPAQVLCFIGPGVGIVLGHAEDACPCAHARA